MLRRVIDWALAICIGAVCAAEVPGQTLPDQTPQELTNPQTPPSSPDMTGWNRVGELPYGQRIIVSTGSGFPIHCAFRGITDHSLLCDQGSLLLGLNQREIARDQVAWLRIDNFPRNRAILAGISAGAGAALGAAAADTDSLRPLGALLGGSVGLGVGTIASAPMAFSNSGKTIYVQPTVQPGPPTTTHLRWPQLKKRPAPQVELAHVQ
jgi:hypothetical protein